MAEHPSTIWDVTDEIITLSHHDNDRWFVSFFNSGSWVRKYLTDLTEEENHTLWRKLDAFTQKMDNHWLDELRHQFDGGYA